MKALITMILLFASAPAGAQERFTAEQRAARFSYDLGPDEVNVTSYPKAQRDNYEVFAKTCSQCHTLARAINSPLVSREDWRRFIKRMYAKTKMRSGAEIGSKDAKAAIEFLAYDSQIRKVKGKAAFEARARELNLLFLKARSERSRVQIESDKKKIQEPAPYMGGK